MLLIIIAVQIIQLLLNKKVTFYLLLVQFNTSHEFFGDFYV